MTEFKTSCPFISLLNFQSNYGRWLDQIKSKNVNKIIQKGLLSPLPIPHAMSLILLVSLVFGSAGGLWLYVLQYSRSILDLLVLGIV